MRNRIQVDSHYAVGGVGPVVRILACRQNIAINASQQRSQRFASGELWFRLPRRLESVYAKYDLRAKFYIYCARGRGCFSVCDNIVEGGARAGCRGPCGGGWAWRGVRRAGCGASTPGGSRESGTSDEPIVDYPPGNATEHTPIGCCSLARAGPRSLSVFSLPLRSYMRS